MKFTTYFISFLINIVLIGSTVNDTLGQENPTPKDLLEFNKPTSLALSPNGNQVIVGTKKASVDSNRHRSTIWNMSTEARTATQELNFSRDVQGIEWFPDSKHIAYLAPADNGRQIWEKEIGSGSSTQLTHHANSITSFSLSPDGTKIAFTTTNESKDKQKEHSQFSHSTEVNLKTFGARQLFGNRLSPYHAPQTELWVKGIRSKSKIKVSDTLTVEEYKWSPSGNRIALIAKPFSIVKPGVISNRSDIYVFNTGDGGLQTIRKGKQGKGIYEGTIGYSEPFWGPSERRLGFVRIDESDRWAAAPDLGIYNFKTEETRYIIQSENNELEAPTFHWFNPDHILVEYTDRARSGLFQVSVKSGSISPLHVSNRHASGFTFSQDGTKTVWISQSVGSPPEMYAAEIPINTKEKISNFNSTRDIWLPEAKYVEWDSKDGTKVQGWYVPPKNLDRDNPPPLLTLVHGGPGYEVNNTFQPYLQQWPYPVQIFAAKGYAVFIPNYRGTDSFSQTYQMPSARDREPVQDVISGIKHLVSNDLANESKLGIMGHSHGVLVGPQVIADWPTFKAASFAEGAGNLLSLYGQGRGWANKTIIEHEMVSSTPYENPDRYLELSAAFLENFTKTTPTLLEFGQQASAYQGIEIGKALWRHQTPHKFVVYPEGGHSLRDPAAQVESMKRNLKWFAKWVPVEDSVANTSK
jgi:dipeptidyl aminopeptidase/acylaminoacyl peptidase